MIMKLLLVMPYTTVYPVGITYISSALKQAGHSVDGVVFRSPEAMVRQMRTDCDFVVTGGLSSQYARLMQIVGVAKEAGVRTVVGGGIITSEPELMSQAMDVDFAIVGEGEDTIVELMSCVEHKRDLSLVRGLCYKADGKHVFTGESKPIESLDARPWPDYGAFGFEEHLALSAKMAETLSFPIMRV
jgi:radical SAM superfamily enzyme YgiQ (UPF0313 family)